MQKLTADVSRDVAASPEEWMKFLDTAARLYRYTFPEQLLIYAQRPEATAVASMEIWNKRMYLYEYCGLVEKSPDIATEVNEKESAANHKEVQSEAVTVKCSDRSAGEKKKSIHDRLKENKEKLGQKSGKDNPQKGVELT